MALHSPSRTPSTSLYSSPSAEQYLQNLQAWSHFTFTRETITHAFDCTAARLQDSLLPCEGILLPNYKENTLKGVDVRQTCTSVTQRSLCFPAERQLPLSGALPALTPLAGCLRSASNNDSALDSDEHVGCVL